MRLSKQEVTQRHQGIKRDNRGDRHRNLVFNFVVCPRIISRLSRFVSWCLCVTSSCSSCAVAIPPTYHPFRNRFGRAHRGSICSCRTQGNRLFHLLQCVSVQ